MNRNNLIKTWIREIKGMIWKMILKRDDTILTICNHILTICNYILVLKLHFLTCMKHFPFLIDGSIHNTIRILKVKIKMHNIVRNLYKNLEKINRSFLKERRYRYIWSKGKRIWSQIQEIGSHFWKSPFFPIILFALFCFLLFSFLFDVDDRR